MAGRRGDHRQDRPSGRECAEMLVFARGEAAKGRIGACWPPRLRAQMHALGWITPDEMRKGFIAVLAEAQPKHYAGTRPPEISGDQECRGCELYAFCWQSPYTSCRLYLKFVKDAGLLKIVSLHPSDTSRGKRKGTS